MIKPNIRIKKTKSHYCHLLVNTHICRFQTLQIKKLLKYEQSVKETFVPRGEVVRGFVTFLIIWLDSDVCCGFHSFSNTYIFLLQGNNRPVHLQQKHKIVQGFFFLKFSQMFWGISALSVALSSPFVSTSPRFDPDCIDETSGFPPLNIQNITNEQST